MADSTYRLGGRFQSGKDPQQDAIIAWLGTLPKDARGDIKRSVVKYHLTRALLLYIQSGADTSTAVLGAPRVARPASAPHPAEVPHSASALPAAAVTAPVPVSAPEPSASPPPTPSGGKGGLRARIGRSMQTG